MDRRAEGLDEPRRQVTKLPPGFRRTRAQRRTRRTPPSTTRRKLFGLQFHPEVAHTPRGKQIISNFVHGICGCGRNWTMQSFIEQAVEEIRAQVGNERVILGLTGGVDSSVAAALLHKAIGDQLTCIFVNNGLLRGGEAEGVQQRLRPRTSHMQLQYEDASKLFLTQLRGVTDPERKRKIIGRTFIEVFEEADEESRRTRRVSSRRARSIPT